jgi:hypothetical protein
MSANIHATTDISPPIAGPRTALRVAASGHAHLGRLAARLAR